MGSNGELRAEILACLGLLGVHQSRSASGKLARFANLVTDAADAADADAYDEVRAEMDLN